MGLFHDAETRRYYQTLLMETEKRGDVQKQVGGIAKDVHLMT